MWALRKIVTPPTFHVTPPSTNVSTASASARHASTANVLRTELLQRRGAVSFSCSACIMASTRLRASRSSHAGAYPAASASGGRNGYA